MKKFFLMLAFTGLMGATSVSAATNACCDCSNCVTGCGVGCDCDCCSPVGCDLGCCDDGACTDSCCE